MRRNPSILSRGAFVLVTSLILLAACGTPGPTTPTTVSNAPTIVVPVTPSPQEIPLPTLLPTVQIAVSPIPVTVAPVTTEIPSVTPIAVTATVVQPTRRVATATPKVPATPFPEGMPKVLVSAIRVDPPLPKADTPGNFIVTFQNRSGENLGYRWVIEIWREDEEHSFGITDPQNSTMPPGETVLISSGWAPRGQGDCVFFRAKPIALDEDDNRTDFVQANGTPLWLDFNVCP
jgi:hypothetical protein